VDVKRGIFVVADGVGGAAAGAVAAKAVVEMLPGMVEELSHPHPSPLPIKGEGTTDADERRQGVIGMQKAECRVQGAEGRSQLHPSSHPHPNPIKGEGTTDADKRRQGVIGMQKAEGRVQGAEGRTHPHPHPDPLPFKGEGASDPVAELLKSAVAELSARLREQTKDLTELRGMCSTVVLALVRGKDVYVAHAGYSRAYLLAKGKLEQLTRDHSLVATILELGQITPEQARVHPLRSRITRCVGMEGKAVADVRRIEVKSGYRLLLCTDGLTGMVPDAEIARMMEAAKTPKVACRSLVDAANEAGGADNITALVVEFKQP
jgi:serine/threonine protein phosphatase PrpC